jgi:16S rRNA (cytosine1402-N4)-methyltransferase
MMYSSSSGAELPHDPVLYQEIILALQPRRGGHYIDGTLGAGGHAWGILEASFPDGLLLGLDLDPTAIELARKWLAPFGPRLITVHASYTSIGEQVEALGWQGVDAVLLDLGVSSMQLDTSAKGFTFQSDAPLDMRFNPDDPISAGDLANNLSEKDLADLIYRYGEERYARNIARAIVRSRPILTTRQLAGLVVNASGKSGKKDRIHPATRTFQALRIAVNRELENLENALPAAIGVLNPGGRLAVISYHSLEDRIVKQTMRKESQDCICPPQQPVCTCGHKATIKEITRRPIRPGDDELTRNPRSRSARLRVAEKL